LQGHINAVLKNPKDSVQIFDQYKLVILMCVKRLRTWHGALKRQIPRELVPL